MFALEISSNYFSRDILITPLRTIARSATLLHPVVFLLLGARSIPALQQPVSMASVARLAQLAVMSLYLALVADQKLPLAVSLYVSLYLI